MGDDRRRMLNLPFLKKGDSFRPKTVLSIAPNTSESCPRHSVDARTSPLIRKASSCIRSDESTQPVPSWTSTNLLSVSRRIEISAQTGNSQERFRPCPLLFENGSVMPFFGGKRRQKRRIRITLDNAVPNSRPTLAQRLLLKRSADVFVLGKAQTACIELNEPRTGTFSLALEAFNQRSYAVSTDAFPKIPL